MSTPAPEVNVADDFSDLRAESAGGEEEKEDAELVSDGLDVSWTSEEKTRLSAMLREINSAHQRAKMVARRKEIEDTVEEDESSAEFNEILIRELESHPEDVAYQKFRTAWELSISAVDQKDSNRRVFLKVQKKMRDMSPPPDAERILGIIARQVGIEFVKQNVARAMVTSVMDPEITFDGVPVEHIKAQVTEIISEYFPICLDILKFPEYYNAVIDQEGCRYINRLNRFISEPQMPDDGIPRGASLAENQASFGSHQPYFEGPQPDLRQPTTQPQSSFLGWRYPEQHAQSGAHSAVLVTQESRPLDQLHLDWLGCDETTPEGPGQKPSLVFHYQPHAENARNLLLALGMPPTVRVVPNDAYDTFFIPLGVDEQKLLDTLSQQQQQLTRQPTSSYPKQ